MPAASYAYTASHVSLIRPDVTTLTIYTKIAFARKAHKWLKGTNKTLNQFR